uniref:phosphoinositide phospholipase C n=1 Tax=Mus musculus TaxID=10090 RepID=Q9DAC8_MOUSE|nr:unnamed protein product [Mus musculus]
MEIDHSDSVEIINKYEPIEEVKGERQMSIEGFARYMFSSECLLFKENCKTVYQDMNHPLSDYFISSSHNTYLISDQILGPSDIWGYVRHLWMTNLSTSLLSLLSENDENSVLESSCEFLLLLLSPLFIL